MLRTLVLATALVALPVSPVLAQTPPAPAPVPAAAPVPTPAYTIRQFTNQGFEVAFLAFEKAIQLGPDFVTIGGKETKDRGGALVNTTLDLSPHASTTPYLILRPGPNNQASHINLLLADASGTTARFQFALKDLPTDRFSVVYPADGDQLSSTGNLSGKDKDAPPPTKLDLAKITQWQLQGNWQGKTFEVAVSGIHLATDVPATVTDARTKAAQRRQREAEERQKQAQARAAKLKDLMENCPHPADGTRVLNIAPVGSDLLGIELQSGQYIPGALEPYTPQPDDKLTGGKQEWTARDGKMVQELVGQKVQRKGPGGKYADLGTLTFDKKSLLKPDRITGTQLEVITLQEPAAYQISSTTDPAYATPTSPLAVHRKSKPNSPNGAENGFSFLHRAYLKLPQPLKEGATYTITFKALNTKDPSVQYTHISRQVRSEAVHASHVGYHPAAPFKRAYLSIWLGTGGGYDDANIDSFELLDAKTNQPVFTGKVQLGKAKDAPEQLKEEKNYAMTAVRWLDFSSFTTPGEYKVHVPGIGTSYPFRIAADVWQNPFKLSLQGLLSQRSGIALGPPFLQFNRPRPYHPDDGVKFYQLDIGLEGGQEGGRGEALLRLFQKNGKLDEVTGVWGGYQDAGDWDSYTTSLITANLLTELFDVTSDFSANMKLSLPPNEASDKIPDLLNEALWGLEFFQRIQLPDGGVREGFGDGWGCRDGDVSWNNSNPIGVYAARPGTSYHYAGAAASMARLLAPYDKPRADGLAASAAKAWKWAEAQPAADGKRDIRSKAYAAVQLYWLTRDAAYHDAFKQITELTQPVPAPESYNGGWIEPLSQNDATFAYARLPDNLADATLKANAIKRFALAAKVAQHFSAHNSFNVATAYPGIPCGDFLGYFTAPGGVINVDVVRAHHLLRTQDTLATLVASTNFTLGANPENMAMTTGLGPNPVQFPLRLDSRRTGQPAPAGLTVYGAADQSTPGAEWVHIWVIGQDRTVPNSRTWPAQESYYDIFGWPGCNEYTVDRPIALAAYTWGYLASLAR